MQIFNAWLRFVHQIKIEKDSHIEKLQRYIPHSDILVKFHQNNLLHANQEYTKFNLNTVDHSICNGV